MAEKEGRAKAVSIPVIVFAVFALLLAGINIFTGPIIESNGSAKLLTPLYAVMPEAKGFELIYTAEDSADSALAEVPATVKRVYAESSGLGYALSLSTTEGYTGGPMDLTMAVDAEGRISGINVDYYPDSRDFGADYPATYLEQDSALGGVSLVAGVTYSSKAFHNAVSDGFNALIANGLIGAGVRSDAQVLLEQLPVLGSGMVNSEGVAQYEEQDISGESFAYIRQGFKALNGAMVACVAVDGESSYLALCNLSGSCTMYDVNGAEVTADVPAELGLEVTEYAEGLLESMENADLKLLGRTAPEGSAITAAPLEGVYSSVTGAYLIDDGGTQYYAYVARPYGYGNLPLTLAFVLDGHGVISAMNAEELILMKEYFRSYTLDESAYKAGFKGLTKDSWSGEQALISGATVSSNAVSIALTDVFNAFAGMNG